MNIQFTMKQWKMLLVLLVAIVVNSQAYKIINKKRQFISPVQISQWKGPFFNEDEQKTAFQELLQGGTANARKRGASIKQSSELDFDPNQLFNPEIEKTAKTAQKHSSPEAETYLGVLPKGAEDDDEISPQERLAHLVSKPIIDDMPSDFKSNGENDGLNEHEQHHDERHFNDDENDERNDDESERRHFHDNEGRFQNVGHRFNGHGPRFYHDHHFHGNQQRHYDEERRYKNSGNRNNDDHRGDNFDDEPHLNLNPNNFRSHHDNDGNFISHIHHRDGQGKEYDNMRTGNRRAFDETGTDQERKQDGSTSSNLEDLVIYQLSHSKPFKKSNIPLANKLTRYEQPAHYKKSGISEVKKPKNTLQFNRNQTSKKSIVKINIYNQMKHENNKNVISLRNSTRKSGLPVIPGIDSHSTRQLLRRPVNYTSPLSLLESRRRTSILDNIQNNQQSDGMVLPRDPTTITGENTEAFGPQFSEPYHGGRNSGSQGYSKGEYFGEDLPDEEDNRAIANLDKMSIQHSLEGDSFRNSLESSALQKSSQAGSEEESSKMLPDSGNRNLLGEEVGHVRHGEHWAPPDVVNNYFASPDTPNSHILLPEETLDGFHDNNLMTQQHNEAADTRSHEDSEQEHAIQSIQDDMSIDDELENTGLGTPVNNHHPAQRRMQDTDGDFPSDLMELDHFDHHGNNYDTPRDVPHEHEDSQDSVPLHDPENFDLHNEPHDSPHHVGFHDEPHDSPQHAGFHDDEPHDSSHQVDLHDEDIMESVLRDSPHHGNLHDVDDEPHIPLEANLRHDLHDPEEDGHAHEIPNDREGEVHDFHGSENDHGRDGDVGGHGFGEFGQGLPLVPVPQHHEMTEEEYGKHLDDVMSQFFHLNRPLWATRPKSIEPHSEEHPDHHVEHHYGNLEHGKHYESHHFADDEKEEQHENPPARHIEDDDVEHYHDNFHGRKEDHREDQYEEEPPYDYLTGDHGNDMEASHYHGNEHDEHEEDEHHAHYKLPEVGLRVSHAPTWDKGKPSGSQGKTIPDESPASNKPVASAQPSEVSQNTVPIASAQPPDVSQNNAPTSASVQGNSQGSASIQPNTPTNTESQASAPVNGDVEASALGNPPVVNGGNPQADAFQGNEPENNGVHQGTGTVPGDDRSGDDVQPPVNHSAMKQAAAVLPPKPLEHKPIAALKSNGQKLVHLIHHAVPPELQHVQLPAINIHHMPLQPLAHAALKPAADVHPVVSKFKPMNDRPLASIEDGLESPSPEPANHQAGAGIHHLGSNAAAMRKDCCKRNDETCCSRALSSPMMNEGDQVDVMETSNAKVGAIHTKRKSEGANTSSRQFKDVMEAYKIFNISIPSELEIAELKAELRELKSKQQIGAAKSKTPQNIKVEKAHTKDGKHDDHKEPKQAKAPNGAAEVTRLIQDMGSRAVSADPVYAPQYQRLQQLNLQQQGYLVNMLKDTAAIINQKPKPLKIEDPEQHTVETILNLGHETDPGVQEAQLISILRKMQRAAADATANYFDSLKNRKHPQPNANVNYFIKQLADKVNANLETRSRNSKLKSRDDQLKKKNSSLTILDKTFGNSPEIEKNHEELLNTDSDKEGVVEISKEDIGLVKTLDETGDESSSRFTGKKNSKQVNGSNIHSNDPYADLGFSIPSQNSGKVAKKSSN